MTRQRIGFNQLRAPFTVGAGKFRLKDAYMNGPMLGATMRGTVDFKAQTVDLGGTYVPLYGLNSALGAIPILGRVLVGRQGEGVVGITFAIKGKLDDPSVLVNPMSVMTPGIFRQIFEFTGSVPGSDRTVLAVLLHASLAPITRARLRNRAQASHRPDQSVPLLAERELDHAVFGEIGRSEEPLSRRKRSCRLP